MPGQFYLLHHPVSFLYSFFQKTLMKKVKEKGQKVFLLVQSLFPVLSKQEAPHHTFKKTSDQYTCMIYNDTLTICYIWLWTLEEQTDDFLKHHSFFLAWNGKSLKVYVLWSRGKHICCVCMCTYMYRYITRNVLRLNKNNTCNVLMKQHE